MAFCVNCGKKVPEGVVFCPYCGTNLKEIMGQLEQSRQNEQQMSSAAEAPRMDAPQNPQQENPFGQTSRQEPPYAQQGYRAPYYTQKEDLGYLHQKSAAQPVPARGLGLLGRLTGIFGMISSIVLMATMLLFVSLNMEKGVTPMVYAFEEKAVLLFAAALEGVILSFLGIFLSHRAAAKGNPSTAAGKRLGIVGLILSALNVVDLILFLIVLLMG